MRAMYRLQQEKLSPKIAIEIKTSFSFSSLLRLALRQSNESVQEAGGYRGKVYE